MSIKRIQVKYLLVISVILLAITNVLSYMLLLTNNNKWKNEVTEINVHTSVVAEALSQHVYYDGDSIPHNQMLRLIGKDGNEEAHNSVNEIFGGDKVILLLSSNCCISCAQSEIVKLLELSKQIGREKLVVVADFAMREESILSNSLDTCGYYETNLEHLGLRGIPMRESAVVLLAQNGRIRTSFIVCPQTSNHADIFHGYLLQYFKEKK